MCALKTIQGHFKTKILFKQNSIIDKILNEKKENLIVYNVL